MRELKFIMFIGYWILFLGGLICLGMGTYYRFTVFDDFKLWQASMGLGIATLTVSGILAFLRSRVE